MGRRGRWPGRCRRRRCPGRCSSRRRCRCSRWGPAARRWSWRCRRRRCCGRGSAVPVAVGDRRRRRVGVADVVVDTDEAAGVDARRGDGAGGIAGCYVASCLSLGAPPVAADQPAHLVLGGHAAGGVAGDNGALVGAQLVRPRCSPRRRRPARHAAGGVAGGDTGARYVPSDEAADIVGGGAMNVRPWFVSSPNTAAADRLWVTEPRLSPTSPPTAVRPVAEPDTAAAVMTVSSPAKPTSTPAAYSPVTLPVTDTPLMLVVP